jgi:hypothetical protein
MQESREGLLEGEERMAAVEVDFVLGVPDRNLGEHAQRMELGEPVQLLVVDRSGCELVVGAREPGGEGPSCERDDRLEWARCAEWWMAEQEPGEGDVIGRIGDPGG